MSRPAYTSPCSICEADYCTYDDDDFEMANKHSEYADVLKRFKELFERYLRQRYGIKAGNLDVNTDLLYMTDEDFLLENKDLLPIDLELKGG